MFGRLALRGVGGTLRYHRYSTAAVLKTWAVTIESKIGGGDGTWRLSATIATTDRFLIRQRPLYFIAARPGGFWSWPVEEIQQLSATALLARLGPPEH